jgi:hypothetical protein
MVNSSGKIWQKIERAKFLIDNSRTAVKNIIIYNDPVINKSIFQAKNPSESASDFCYNILSKRRKMHPYISSV